MNEIVQVCKFFTLCDKSVAEISTSVRNLQSFHAGCGSRICCSQTVENCFNCKKLNTKGAIHIL